MRIFLFLVFSFLLFLCLSPSHSHSQSPSPSYFHANSCSLSLSEIRRYSMQVDKAKRLFRGEDRKTKTKKEKEFNHKNVKNQKNNLELSMALEEGGKEAIQRQKIDPQKQRKTRRKRVHNLFLKRKKKSTFIMANAHHHNIHLCILPSSVTASSSSSFLASSAFPTSSSSSSSSFFSLSFYSMAFLSANNNQGCSYQKRVRSKVYVNRKKNSQENNDKPKPFYSRPLLTFLSSSSSSTSSSSPLRPSSSLFSSKKRNNEEEKPIVYFVTSNPMKTREVERLLSDGNLVLPFDIEPIDIELPELQEDPVTISREKCRLAASYIDGPCIVEDTSLCFSALDGLPGPYIKWFLESLGNQGLVNLLAAYPDKSAYAMCQVAFSPGPSFEPVVFGGNVYGTIVQPQPNLEEAFGWDPIFLPSGFSETFSDMDIEEKNRISHRSNALTMFQAYVKDNRKKIMKELEYTIEEKEKREKEGSER